jgi:O-antigen ligase
VWRLPTTPLALKTEQALGLAAWLPAVFWVVYAISNTLLAGPPRIGPFTAVNVLYLLMIPSAVRLVLQWRRLTVPGLIIYGAFIAWVLLSLFWRAPAFGVEAPKIILVYGLLGLAAAQSLTRSRAAVRFAAGCLATSAILTIWTFWSLIASGFEPRAGISVNPNYVATLIAPGVLVVLVWYFESAQSRWRRTCLLAALASMCALFLLGSRGVLIALFPAAAIVWLRTRRSVAPVRPLLIAAALAILLAQFPTAVKCGREPLFCINEQQYARFQHFVALVEAFAQPSAAPPRERASDTKPELPIAPTVAVAPEAIVAVATPEKARVTSSPQPSSVPDAPVVVNSGEGRYEAERRYYRIRWRTLDGERISWESRPSPPVEFLPSGTGVAARVMRPIPPHQGETHWTMEQSANGQDWNQMLGSVPIDEAWLDDASAVSAYPTERRRTAFLGRLRDWSTVSVRTVLWTAGVSQLFSGPRQLFAGGGMGESQVVSFRQDRNYNSIHNSYLQIALDFGLIGLGLFIAFHWRVLDALRSQTGSIPTLFLAGVVFWLLAGLTATATDLHAYWWFIGVAMAVGRNR